jgi:hypothetical protein
MHARAHSEHVQIIRCDIKLEPVVKCRDAKNVMISEKIVRVCFWTHFLKRRRAFSRSRTHFRDIVFK